MKIYFQLFRVHPEKLLFPEKAPPHENNKGGDGNNRQYISDPVKWFGGKSQFVDFANALFTARASRGVQRQIDIAVGTFFGHMNSAFFFTVTLCGHGACSL
jgi:hypothetical protein